MRRSSTILVVEDDESLRDIFRRSLERAGFHVRTAAHGKEALVRFHEGNVDLVLTDILMPELDGFELIRILKREAPALPVVAISGINDAPNFRNVAVNAGAALAVCKPVNPRDLIKLVRQQMNCDHPVP